MQSCPYKHLKCQDLKCSYTSAHYVKIKTSIIRVVSCHKNQVKLRLYGHLLQALEYALNFLCSLFIQLLLNPKLKSVQDVFH